MFFKVTLFVYEKDLENEVIGRYKILKRKKNHRCGVHERSTRLHFPHLLYDQSSLTFSEICVFLNSEVQDRFVYVLINKFLDEQTQSLFFLFVFFFCIKILARRNSLQSLFLRKKKLNIQNFSVV